MNRELVVYGRRFGCWDQTRALAFLERHNIAYRFVDISRDPEAMARLEEWVGCLSVPTMVVAHPGEVEPVEAPRPLDPRRRIRGQHRGTLISEPSDDQLATFLAEHKIA